MECTVIPHKHDVLFGRGSSINNHPGNQHFRSLVDRHKQEFVTAPCRRHKRSVALRVIAEINGLDPPGRFLMEDASSSNKTSNQGENNSADCDGESAHGIHSTILAKSWIRVEHDKAIAKVLHRLRDKNEGTATSVGAEKDNASSLVHGSSHSEKVQKPKKPRKPSKKKSAQLEQENGLTGRGGENPSHAVESMSCPTIKPLETDVTHFDHSQVISQDPCGQSVTETLYEPNDHRGGERDQNCLLVHSEDADDFEAMIDMVVGNNDLKGNSSTASGNTPIKGKDASDSCRIGNNGSMSIAAVGPSGGEQDEFESMVDMVVDNRKTSWHGMSNGAASTETGTTQMRMRENSNTDTVNQDIMGQDMNGQDEDEWDVLLQQLNKNFNDTNTQQNNALLQQTQQQDFPEKVPSSLDKQSPSISGSVNGSGVGNAVATTGHTQLIRQMENQECLVANEDAIISTKIESHHITGQMNSDEDVELFLRDFSLMHDESDVLSSRQRRSPKQTQEQLQQDQSQAQQVGQMTGGQGLGPQEVTLHQWIEGNIPQANQLQRASTLLLYVKRALVVAKKLVEFLIETDANNAVSLPQSSIAAENIFIWLWQSSNNNGMPIIDNVLIMSIGDCSSVGTTMSRLAALGAVLYELFVGEKPVLLEEGLPPAMGSIGLEDVNYHVNGTNACNNNNIDGPRRKKKQSSSSENGHSQCIHRLESLGLPYSICTLVRNLLDAKYGDLSPDDTYTSFQDVHMDISLMINNPKRFLENIQINPLPDLVICNDKLYGREKEVKRLEQCFRLYTESKACSGVTIMGEAGVGKSKLSMHIRDLSTSQGVGGYFLTSKFDQNKDVYPLATIGALFNTLCDFFVQDATHDQLAMVDKALESALGSSAAFLASVVPSLAKIMPSCGGLSPSGNYIDSAMLLRFQISQLLDVISSAISSTIVILLDDVHWADQASLMLIGGLILNNHLGSKSVFFTCCYRNDEARDNEPFQQWLASIEGCSMESIHVENMNVDGVHDLVSNTLHLSPRITRPLASVLHHKTRGNPLFLRRLMNSLNEQGLIYVNLSRPGWDWDLERIMDVKITDDVVTLLIMQMQRLPEELQLGLQVASCVGSSIQPPLIGILSEDLNQNLYDILNRVSQGGYMDKEDGNRFSWVHDKIQQAAYQMMHEQKRKENHMRIGLAVCAKSMADGGEERNDLFFLAVNQINKGGLAVLSNLAQRTTIAALNLKAGRRAILLSDFNAALKLFKHGISFLDQANHWQNQYTLSLDLFDAISEVACITNDRELVQCYSQELISRARCFEDKLNCLYAATKALRHAEYQQESMESTLTILSQLGEPSLRPLGELTKEMAVVEGILQSTTDESIYGMAQCNEKRFVICQKLYANLLHILHFLEPQLIGAASLRMIELTLRNGMCSISPLAFSYFGETLAAVGEIDTARRLGGIALRLLEKKDCSRHKASVIATVYQLIMWSANPFQAIADAHLLGYKAGMQSGDILYGKMNEYLSVFTGFLAGNDLSEIRQRCRDFVLEILNTKKGFSVTQPSLLHMHAIALAEGLNVLGSEEIDGVPGLREVLGIAVKKNDSGALAIHKTYSLARAFLFRQLDETSLEVNLSDTVFAKKIPIRPMVLLAIFYEALIFFQFARTSKYAAKWIAKGDFLLKKMQDWNEHCCWNFENKSQLLEAEKMNLAGQFDQAKMLYIKSITSAREHKFIHEEAIASELAGMFYYERGSKPKACTLLEHSVGCFKKWGATAVAKRVEANIQRLFGLDLPQLQLMNCKMEPFASREIASKKRQDLE